VLDTQEVSGFSSEFNTVCGILKFFLFSLLISSTEFYQIPINEFSFISVKTGLKSFDHSPGACRGYFLEVPTSCLLTILVIHCQGEITTFLGIARMYILKRFFCQIYMAI
jgi:hypothetical protein